MPWKTSNGKFSKDILPLVRLRAISGSLMNGVDLAVDLAVGLCCSLGGEKSDVETSAVCMSCAQNDRILMYVSDL